MGEWRPGWLTPTALSLAQAAYNERLPSGHFDIAKLAVLADALEEAGCSEQAILDHLRSLGPHVRGCWAIDLVLAKEYHDRTRELLWTRLVTAVDSSRSLLAPAAELVVR